MDENWKVTALHVAYPILALGAVIFGASPFMWAIGKWHCWWFAAAPVCQ